MKYLIIFAAFLVLYALDSIAGQDTSLCVKSSSVFGGTQCAPVTSSSPFPTSTTIIPQSTTSAYSAVTIANTSGVALAAGTRVFLDIVNESATVSIACNLGGVAVVNGAGSITIPAGWHRSWPDGGTFVPADVVNCITATGNVAASIGVK